MKQLEESQNWLHINLACKLSLKEALLSDLHLKNLGLPKDGKKLFKRMVRFKQEHEEHLKNVIRQDQWDIILPPSQVSNSKHWDITIIKVVIQYAIKIHPPNAPKGWETKSLDPNDISIASFVCRAKNLRNVIKHTTVSQMQDPGKYNDLLSQMISILRGLNYKHMKSFYELRKVHHHVDEVMNLLKVTFHKLNEEMHEAMEVCNQNREDIHEHRRILDIFTVRFEELNSMVFQVSGQSTGAVTKELESEIRFLKDNRSYYLERLEPLESDTKKERTKNRKSIEETQVEVEKI